MNGYDDTAVAMPRAKVRDRSPAPGPVREAEAKRRREAEEARWAALCGPVTVRRIDR